MIISGPYPLKDIRTKTDELRGQYIKQERDKLFRFNLDRLFECDEQGNLTPKVVKFTATGETRGLVVTDEAGGGKTSLIRQAIVNHPALQPSEASKMPCVCISVPSPATAKSVGLEILAATGCPLESGSLTAQRIWANVSYRFRLLGTVVLWIDEAHDVFPKRSKSEAPAILKTLKSLMQGEGAVVVILSGIDSLWDNISLDDQVKRRYRRFALPEVSTSSDRKMLRKILENFVARAGLEMPLSEDLVDRLVHAGRHRFGRCVEQMIDAIEVALMQGDQQLGMHHFAEVFFAQEGCSVSENVFLAPRWSAIDLSARAA
ncbi:TniB family NTP-binding protein [Limimaricola variabilis]